MGVGGVAEFTGVLVGRKYRPGHTYVQLIFRTADGIQLSLSRNIQMVRGLNPGQAYHVQGLMHSVGQKIFVRDPMVTLIQRSSSNRHAWLAMGTAGLVLFLGAGGVFALMPDNPTPTTQIKNQAPVID